ncbi:MAG: TonB family protein [bacterium]
MDNANAQYTEQYTQHLEAARLAAGRGNRSEAERLFTEAIAIGERHLGAEHPSLCVALNELGRLCIRRADYARAEPVLERLLQITRAKGSDHPDVATALAGLAVAKRGLGDDTAAEELYRRALWIREEALAPGHMATVVTMEQLSETCATRGNVVEALTLLQRALPTREAALGAEHATVTALRSRIAALELHPVMAVATRLDVAHHDVAQASQQATTAPLSADSTELSPTRRTAGYSLAGLAVAALVIAAVIFRSSAGIGVGGLFASAGSEQHPASIVTTASIDGSTALGAAAVVNSARAFSAHSVNTSSQLLALNSSTEARTLDSVTHPAEPSLPAAPRRLAAVTMPIIVADNVDSLVRASIKKVGRDLSADEFGMAGLLRSSPIGNDVSGKPPVLIGTAPLPYFPDALRSQRTEGEVTVRFRVDERGRADVSSMTVVKSDHELFTLAVRNALPRFRFEPARSPAPESKPRAEWVDFRSEFTVKN